MLLQVSARQYNTGRQLEKQITKFEGLSDVKALVYNIMLRDLIAFLIFNMRLQCVAG